MIGRFFPFSSGKWTLRIARLEDMAILESKICTPRSILGGYIMAHGALYNAISK